MVKNPPPMQETQEMQVPSLGREDPTEKKIATHSSILAWRIPWTEEPSGLQSMVWQKIRHNWGLNTYNVIWIRNRILRHTNTCLAFVKLSLTSKTEELKYFPKVLFKNLENRLNFFLLELNLSKRHICNNSEII